MGEQTAIAWCDHTFNPVIGCTPVSAGCDFCYAEREAKRRNWAKWGVHEPRHRTSELNWQNPIRWNKKALEAGVRRKVFCASLADVFDAEWPQQWRDDLFALIDKTPALDWLLLTKRPNLISKLAPLSWKHCAPRNVWLGTSVESSDTIWRAAALARIPAVVHFLSCEPLLSALPELVDALVCQVCGHFRSEHDDIEPTGLRARGDDWSYHHWQGIDWVIAGGESGGPAERRLVFGPVPGYDPSFRPTPKGLAWMRSIRDQCVATKTPFLLKQFGGPTHASAGRMLDGREWLEFPDPVEGRRLWHTPALESGAQCKIPAF